MLKGKTVVLGVTGSIAAYKMANVASMLIKMHADVHVIMTQNACQFITPVTFETLTGNKCMVDTFDRNFQFHVAHVSIAKKADVVLVAPASANVIGKLANGIADDMLTTTVMACTCKIIVAPAMNTNMYHNPILQDNLKKLSGYGYEIIAPERGMLACRDEGDGKMPSEDVLVNYILREIAYEKDLAKLEKLLENNALQEETRQQAASQLARMIDQHQLELGLEEALTNAGFAPCLVLMQNDALTVAVSASEVTAAQSAVILSICLAHTEVAAENIRIMPGGL